MMPSVKRRVPKHTYSGNKWKTMATNKKYLEVDFDRRCAYCDDADRYNGGKRTYQVDHFAPKSLFPALEFTYENLLYSCPFCNRAKWDTWVGTDAGTSVVDNKGFVSPCTDEYLEHLIREEDGTIKAVTPLGKYMHKNLKLYLQRHSILYLLEQVDERCDLLEQQIENAKNEGKDVSNLQCVHYEVTTVLRKYYKILSNL